MILDRLNAKILFEIQESPGIHKSQICRRVNCKWKYYCGNKNCYGNNRKRGLGRLSRSFCRFPKTTVWRRIQKLKDLGLIRTQRVKKEDDKNKRGWDWFKNTYSTLDVCFGGR